jgi:hypothetical protein
LCPRDHFVVVNIILGAFTPMYILFLYDFKKLAYWHQCIILRNCVSARPQNAVCTHWWSQFWLPKHQQLLEVKVERHYSSEEMQFLTPSICMWFICYYAFAYLYLIFVVVSLAKQGRRNGGATYETCGCQWIHMGRSYLPFIRVIL